jgi:hypothetical protein
LVNKNEEFGFNEQKLRAMRLQCEEAIIRMTDSKYLLNASLISQPMVSCGIFIVNYS